MRPSQISILTVVLLALLGCAPLCAESIDADVQAARAAERTESIRLEKTLDAPAQPVNLSVTETPKPGETKADAKTAPKEVRASSARPNRPAHAATSRPKPIDTSDASAKSDLSNRSDAAAMRGNRPDKVALMMDAGEQQKQSDSKKPGALGTIIFTILKLALVLVLAYLTILALKWFSARHDAIPSNRRQFKMMDTLRFNSTSSLHLVEVKGATLLLGCTAGQVNVLKEFEEDEPTDGESEPAGKFAEYLAKYSDMSQKHGPSGRIAGLLRDCSGYLRDRCHGARTEVRDEK